MLILNPSLLRRKLGGVFYGWRVVVAAFIVNAINDGTFYLGFTVLFLPIGRGLDLSRTATSLPFTLNNVVTTLTGPLLGYLIDRAGPAKVLLYSCLIGGLGFLLLAWTRSYLMFVLVLVGLINVGMMGLIPAVTAAIVPWFVTKRSMAMAVGNSGWAMGGAVFPPLITLGVLTLGWRTTAAIMGVSIWLVVLPLTRVFRSTPEQMGLEPDGLQQEKPSPGRSVPPEPSKRSRAPLNESVTLGEALRSPYVWYLSLATGLHGMIISATSIHFVAIMVWKGLEESTAGYLVGVWAFIMTPMMLGMGWMGDRWSKERVSALGLGIRALGWLLLLTWMDGEVWQMILILVLLSPDFAIFSMSGAIIADRVGPRNYATIRGTMHSVTGIAAVAAPIYSGWVFDRWESYNLVVLPALGMTLLSGLIFWFLPRLGLASR